MSLKITLLIASFFVLFISNLPTVEAQYSIECKITPFISDNIEHSPYFVVGDAISLSINLTNIGNKTIPPTTFRITLYNSDNEAVWNLTSKMENELQVSGHYIWQPIYEPNPRNVQIFNLKKDGLWTFSIAPITPFNESTTFHFRKGIENTNLCWDTFEVIQQNRYTELTQQKENEQSPTILPKEVDFIENTISIFAEKLLGQNFETILPYVLIALIVGYGFLSYFNVVETGNTKEWTSLHILDKLLFGLVAGSIIEITSVMMILSIFFLALSIIDLSPFLSNNFIRIIALYSIVYTVYCAKILKVKKFFNEVNLLFKFSFLNFALFYAIMTYGIVLSVLIRTGAIINIYAIIALVIGSFLFYKFYFKPLSDGLKRFKESL